MEILIIKATVYEQIVFGYLYAKIGLPILDGEIICIDQTLKWEHNSKSEKITMKTLLKSDQISHKTCNSCTKNDRCL